MNILISGAGTVGPLLAIALKRAGHRPRLYDAAAQFGDVGGGINFSPNGLRFVKSLGLLEDVYREGTPMQNAEIRKLDGRLIVSFSGKKIKDTYGIGMTAIKRSRMHRLFLGLAEREGIPIFNGKSITDIRQPDRGEGQSPQLGVEVTFADETRAEGDLLIGADGLNSGTRRILFGPEKPRYTGCICALGVADVTGSSVFDPAITKIFQGNGKQVGTYGIGHNEMVWFYGDYDEQQVPEVWKSNETEKMKPKVLQKFQEWGADPSLAELVHRSSRIMYFGIYDRDPRETWTKGNVTLIGDAAHPMPPHIGQGGNTALEDAGLV